MVWFDGCRVAGWQGANMALADGACQVHRCGNKPRWGGETQAVAASPPQPESRPHYAGLGRLPLIAGARRPIRASSTRGSPEAWGQQAAHSGQLEVGGWRLRRYLGMQPYPWETAEGPSSWDSQQTPARLSQMKRPRIGLDHNSTVHTFSPYPLRPDSMQYTDLHIRFNTLMHIT